LASAIARGSVPPALLLTGPVGVGKYAVARAIAAVVNCLTPRTDEAGLAVDACGGCRSCDRIARNVHVDLLTVEPDDTAKIKVEAIRTVLDQTAFRPFEGKRRFVVLRDADAMLHTEQAAQNALLKSLEEPPAGTIFILTTAIPGALLPTVRSRCIQLQLGRLTEAEVSEVLSRDHGFTPHDARVAAALSDGSVGHALSLGSNDLEELRELALQLLERAAKGNVAARMQAATALAVSSKRDRNRAEVELTLRLISSMLRDIELLNAGADARLLANPSLKDRLQKLARAYAGDRARASFAAVDEAVAAVNRNAGTKVVADWLAVSI
jgi:DNA polymerase-3 subunit delta'